MKNQTFKKSALALAVGTAMVAPAAMADISITGSVRAGVVADDSSVQDFALRSVGSRFIMSASEDIGGGLTGIGRIEVGINPDSTSGGGRTTTGRDAGFDRTRQIWGGLKGGFGTVKIGAQYSAFYDTVTSKGDIAWWGSCFIEFECAREPTVLKYSGGVGGFGFTASVQGVEASNDNNQSDEELDEIEAGVSYQFGPAKIGAAIALDEDFNGDQGTLIGLSATGSFSGVGLSLVLQSADEDFANDTDDNTVVTVTGTFAGFYALFTSLDTSGPTPTNFTLGYQWNIAKKTLMYFEFQQLDADDGSDENTILRAVLKRDFTLTGG